MPWFAPLSLQLPSTPSIPTRRCAGNRTLIRMKLIRSRNQGRSLTTAHSRHSWQRFGFPNRRAITPGNGTSSAAHFRLPYHFLKSRPIASAGCATPRPRTPGHGYPASRVGPAGHSCLPATRRPRGRVTPPPRAAAAGGRRDARAASRPVASGPRPGRALEGPQTTRGVPR